MIRAFAIGLAVGTIRLWVGLFMALGIFDLQGSFAPAFWLAVHDARDRGRAVAAVAAELRTAGAALTSTSSTTTSG